MDELGIVGATGVVLITVGFLLKKLGLFEQWLARARFSRLSTVVAQVGQTNEAYFRSLEGMLQTLERLRAHTEEAEQRLWSIVAQSGEERRKRRPTAALFAAGASDPTARAAMPNRRARRSKTGQSAKPRSGAKLSGERRTTDTSADVAASPVAAGPSSQANKSGRSFARSETAMENRADSLSIENRRPRVNGTAD
jgi:hypothetical protein